MAWAPGNKQVAIKRYQWPIIVDSCYFLVGELYWKVRMIPVYFLSFWPSPLAYSQRMCTGVGGWDTGMNWGRKGWRRQALQSLGDGIREERKTGCTTELGVRLGDSEAVEDMWVCLQATCCPERSSPWMSRGYLLDWTLGQSNQQKDD